MSFTVPSPDAQPAMWWVIRAVLIVYAAVVASNLPENVAAAFNHMAVRLAAALLVVFLSMHDPASAILLAVGFVVSVQTHNQHHITRMANGAVTSGDGIVVDAQVVQSDASVGRTEGFAASVAAASEEDEPIGVPAEADMVAAPVATGSVAAGSMAGATAFSTGKHLADAQDNKIGGQDNQGNEVKTWNEEMGPQGLGPIMGKDDSAEYHPVY